MMTKRCQDILENFHSNPDFLKRVITGDETWVFEYDPDTKRQSLHWKSPQSPLIKKSEVIQVQNQTHVDSIF